MRIKTALLGSAALLLVSGGAYAADAGSDSMMMDSGCPYGAGSISIGNGNCLTISGNVNMEWQYGQDDIVHGFTGDAVTQAGTGPDGAGYGVDALAGPDGEITDTENDDLGAIDDINIGGEVNFKVERGTEFGTLSANLIVEHDNSVKANDLSIGPVKFFRSSTPYGFSAGLGDQNIDHFTGGGTEATGVQISQSIGNGITGTFGVVFAEDGSSGDVSDNSDVPDIVANLELSQPWGSIGVSAAATSVGFDVNDGTEVHEISSEFGFAIGGGAKVNLPNMEGANLVLRGNYAQNAAGYVQGSGGTAADVYLDETEWKNDNGSAFDVGAALNFTLSPMASVNIGASYLDITNDSDGKADGVVQTDNVLNVSGLLTFTPVANFSIGVEGFFSRAAFIANGAAGASDNTDELQTIGGSVKVTRSF